MAAWKIVFLDANTFDRDGDISYKAFTTKWPCVFHGQTTLEETAERIRGFDAVVSNKVVLDEGLLAGVRENLKLVAIAATGTNNVDLEAAKKYGISVCNVAGYSSAAVAQHAFGLILEWASHVGSFSRDNRKGDWARSKTFNLLTYPCVELHGKVLGLIGSGAIGQSVERMAKGFGMEVLRAARKRADPIPEGRVSFDELLARSDFISLHCPLTAETRDLIGEAELRAMKRSAFLINTARGGIVSEAALIDALKNRVIAGAGLDVLTQEPPAADHPMLVAAASMDHLLLTPHCAWSCVESRQRLLNEVAKNIQTFEAGGERNRVGV